MKVSIVTVSFNSEKTILDTIRSVNAQSYPDIEYIVIDGKSSDKTRGILRQCDREFREKEFIYISEEDQGLYDAMNKGIRMATGDIVGIINSDDFYHRTDIIEKIVTAFEEEDIQSVFGDVRFVEATDLNRTIRYYSSEIFSPGKFRYGFMPAHPTFFTYRKNFEKYGYYKTDYKIAADFELLVRFLYKYGLSYKYLSVDFMKMRLGGVSTASLKSNLILNKEIARACKENDIWTCMPLLALKYFVKVFELINTRS